MAFPLSLAVFRARYPEFVDAGGGGAPGDAFVQAKLNEAERRVDSTVWGDKAEDGHGLLTAHLITMSPYGRDARLTIGGVATSTYKVEFDSQGDLVGGAYRLILEDPESLET